MKLDLRSRLTDGQILIGDGGMGTSLYEKGFYINRSFEELSLTHPEAVREVTLAFRQAGAELLTTNTFKANLPRLTEHGLQDQLEKILRGSVEITQSVAGEDAWVGASIGPLGEILEPLGPLSVEEAERLFANNAKILHDAGADAFILETFHDLHELSAALRAIRQVSDRPILASISVQENLKTSYGHTLKEFVRQAEALGADILGLNCQLGPSELLDALEALRPLTKRPISICPNAGLPRYVNDRYMYLCNPDYMGKFAKRFVQAGANLIGGCCGTTPQHIRAIANNVRMLRPTQPQPTRPLVETPVRGEPPAMVPTELRSDLGACLKRGEKVVSVELVPPKGVSVKNFLEHCRTLKQNGVKFVNIPDGARAVARVSSLHLAAYVQREVGLEAIPHFTTRDRNLIGLQSDLLGAHINGIRNILLVTGDPPKLGNCPDATAVYDVDAIGLTHIAVRMNQGLDIGGSPFGEPAQFLVGVAVNPTSINLDLEVQRFHYKVEAGANFAITQPIYDASALHRFFEQAGAAASRLPIIMGVWPLVSLKNAEFLKYEVPGVSVPDWVIHEMEKAGDSPEEALKRGLDIAYKTMQEAQGSVAGFQISAPFNRVSVVMDLLRAFHS